MADNRTVKNWRQVCNDDAYITLGGVSGSPFGSLPVPEHRAPRLNAQRASGTMAVARLHCLARCSPKTSLSVPRSPPLRHVRRHIAAPLCVAAIPALPSLAVCQRLRCGAGSTPRTATAAATALPLRCVAAVQLSPAPARPRRETCHSLACSSVGSSRTLARVQFASPLLLRSSSQFFHEPTCRRNRSAA